MTTGKVAVGLTIRAADPASDAEVRRMFGRLHGFNASLDHRFALAEGWEAVLDAHLSRERREGNGVTWLADWDGDPAGMLIVAGHADSPLYLDRHWAEVLALYVEPEYRGLGVGQALAAEAASWAITHGYDRLQLHVTAANAAAQSFYARSGFRLVQEIWRLDLAATFRSPPADNACEGTYARGEGLLGGQAHEVD
jgi:GNAT superfamily N-acetyltransferase